jgi:hypothetical protein
MYANAARCWARGGVPDWSFCRADIRHVTIRCLCSGRHPVPRTTLPARGQASLAALDSEASAEEARGVSPAFSLRSQHHRAFLRPARRHLLAGFEVGSSAPAVEPWADRVPARRVGIAGAVLILTGLLTHSVSPALGGDLQHAGRLKCSTAADPPRIGHVRCCPEAGKTHSSRRLLLAHCMAATPEVTIHMDGKEMAGRWWTDGPG